MKCPGIGWFVKGALFEKKKKKNFRLGGIQPPSILQDSLSALLSHKGALLWKRRALYGEQFDSIL